VKILLLGANGQLGQTFLEDGRLAGMGTLVSATRDGVLLSGGTCERVDLLSTTSLEALLNRVEPDLIVNTAAYNAVDRAEDEPDQALRVNSDAVREMGAWAAEHGARMVHYSSDYVFDGEKTSPYQPHDPTHPLGAYGRSKQKGEQALIASGAAHMIFRTSWVYSPFGGNFLKTMVHLAGERDDIRVVADQHGAPTSASLIVDGTLAALRHDAGNKPAAVLEHLVASESTTWYEFAQAIFEAALGVGLLQKAPAVHPIRAAEFNSRARRPQFSVLDNSGFSARYGLTLAPWRNGVRDVIYSLMEREGRRPC
jgi:dTDP-4-dehydrorhamnose reductase